MFECKRLHILSVYNAAPYQLLILCIPTLMRTVDINNIITYACGKRTERNEPAQFEHAHEKYHFNRMFAPTYDRIVAALNER